MKALVIGGTRFVGAALVDELLERGAAVTVFSRGQTNPTLFGDGVEHVRGDRSSDLDRLGERTFDVVFDTCGYRPDIVEASAQKLRDRASRYVFLSTASVYAGLEEVDDDARVTEDQAVASMVESATLDSGENYGPLKVLCERAVLERFGDRATVLRPSLIVGPRDYTDRFPYWPVRLAEGGDVLVPGGGDDPAQIIDARDLARFAVHLASSDRGGVFNVTGPAASRVFRELIADCQTDASCQLHWAPADFLAAHDVQPWKDMPCWLARTHPDGAILRLDIERALDAGLEHRSWSQTAADTLAWIRTTDRALPLRAGLSRERESELLALL